MRAVVAAFNQEKALVGAFSVITNLRMELFGALLQMIFSWVLVLVCLVTATLASPYYDFRLRVREYKTRALETTGCGLWQVKCYLVAL